MGKTTLAVEAGHAATERGWFGGGTLFIDLHGYDQAPVEPSQALDALLRALSVPAEHIPPTVEERAGLYRPVLAQMSEPVQSPGLQPRARLLAQLMRSGCWWCRR